MKIMFELGHNIFNHNWENSTGIQGRNIFRRNREYVHKPLHGYAMQDSQRV